MKEKVGPPEVSNILHHNVMHHTIYVADPQLRGLLIKKSSAVRLILPHKAND